MAKAKKKAVEASLKLDLGCGKNPREGFVGVDVKDFGQAIVADLTTKWPWEDSSVEEINCSHMVEHLTAEQRIHFVNELHRVLKKGGKATIVTPHWASCRAYGDLTHQWPPVSEFWYYYLVKEWRAVNAPHNDTYTCDFEFVYGYSENPALSGRDQEYKQYAFANYKESISDLHCILTAKK